VSTEPAPHPARDPACDDARALASLALDGALADEVGQRLLRRHLETCPACAAFAAEIGSVTALMRDAPLEPVRCEPLVRTMQSTGGAHRAPWATTVTAVAAVVLAVASLPHETSNRARDDREVAAAGAARAGLAPVKLPIGQRSAESDFTARVERAGA